MIQVAPLVGYKALSAMYSFQTLLIGLKMLPLYTSEVPEVFFARFGELSDEEKVKFLRIAILSVPLQQKEVESIVALAQDKNGICFSAINMGNMGLEELHETMIAVGLELSRIKIPWLSDEEKKKNFNGSGLTSEPNTASTPA